MHGPIIGPRTLDVSYLRPLLMLMVTLGVATATPAENLRMLGDNPADEGHVDASLIAQHDSWQPGTTVTIGLRLAMDEGWHTYWKNPGDAGMPTSITWDLPDGWAAHGIDWPAPVYFETNGIGGYGYVGTVVLPVRLDVPPDAAPGSVTLKAKADWLECADICIAGSADLQLTGRVGNGEPQAVAEHVELFATAAERQPMEWDSAASDQSRDPAERLSIRLSDLQRDLIEGAESRTHFFPDADDVIDMSARQEFVVMEGPWGNRDRIQLPPNRKATLIGYFPTSRTRVAPPKRLTGVLVIEPPAPEHGEGDKRNQLTGVIVLEAPSTAEPQTLPCVWRIDVPVKP